MVIICESLKPTTAEISEFLIDIELLRHQYPLSRVLLYGVLFEGIVSGKVRNTQCSQRARYVKLQ